MADGMGSAWVPDPSRRRVQLAPGHAIQTQAVIEMFTDRLADERGGTGDTGSAFWETSGYYDALDDLRALVNLPPTDRSRRD